MGDLSSSYLVSNTADAPTVTDGLTWYVAVAAMMGVTTLTTVSTANLSLVRRSSSSPSPFLPAPSCTRTMTSRPGMARSFRVTSPKTRPWLFTLALSMSTPAAGLHLAVSLLSTFCTRTGSGSARGACARASAPWTKWPRP